MTVNIHGLSHKPWRYFNNANNELDCTHDDLNHVLTMLGVKKFKSKKKGEKIQLLLIKAMRDFRFEGMPMLSVYQGPPGVMKIVMYPYVVQYNLHQSWGLSHPRCAT